MSKVININSYRNTWKKVYASKQGKAAICLSIADKTSEIMIMISDKTSGQSIKLSVTDAVRLTVALQDHFFPQE